MLGNAKINAALVLADTLALAAEQIPSELALNTNIALALDVAAKTKAQAIVTAIDICNSDREGYDDIDAAIAAVTAASVYSASEVDIKTKDVYDALDAALGLTTDDLKALGL